MPANRLVILAAAIAGLFIFVLSGIMVWIYASESGGGRPSGAFALVDHLGKPVDESLFKGEPSLVYFGYTHCPVACPTTLFEMSGFLDTLREEGAALNGYFFTIDPERDTRAVMEKYVSAFSGQIKGFTGETEEVRKLIGNWNITAEKVPDGSGGYSMDHTLTLFLVGGDGRLKGLVPYGTGFDEALAKIRGVLLKRSG